MTVRLTDGTLEERELTKIAPENTGIVRVSDNALTRAAIGCGQVDALVLGDTFAFIGLNRKISSCCSG